MVISGKHTRRFSGANYATLSQKRVDGEWCSASTNESWEVFWRELTAHHGDSVELERVDGDFEIQEDARGEYIEVRQDHQSIFAGGEHLTRFRPFIETSTETKPWMEDDP